MNLWQFYTEIQSLIQQCELAESDLLKAEATAFGNNHYLLLKLLSKVFLNAPTVVMSKEAGDENTSFNIKQLCNGTSSNQMPAERKHCH